MRSVLRDRKGWIFMKSEAWYLPFSLWLRKTARGLSAASRGSRKTFEDIVSLIAYCR